MPRSTKSVPKRDMPSWVIDFRGLSIGPLKAWTKSEARALVKQRFKLARLPVGTVVTKQ